MRQRLRAALLGPLVMTLTMTTTAFAAEAEPTAPKEQGVILLAKLVESPPGIPGKLGKGEPLAADELADRDTPWTKEECRKAGADLDRGEYFVSRDSRFSQCIVGRFTYEYSINGTPAAWADFRMTVIQDSHHRDRTMSSHVLLDEWDFRAVDVIAAGKLQGADLTVEISCAGSGGSTCNGRSSRTFTEQKDVSTWSKTPGEDDAFARFGMVSSPRTNPARDSRAKGFLPRDRVSFHTIGQTLTGESASASIKFEEPLRCDRAYYLNSVGGCVWDRTPLIWWVDYKDYPEYAKHLWDAQYHPTKTAPFGSHPGVKIPGGVLPGTPTAEKPLTRLIKGYNPSSLTYYNDTHNLVRSACRRLSGGATEECDEYPMHSTYEGANYSKLHPAEPWKYSVRYIDGQ